VKTKKKQPEPEWLKLKLEAASMRAVFGWTNSEGWPHGPRATALYSDFKPALIEAYISGFEKGYLIGLRTNIDKDNSV
jgi:hypothetical protein